MEIKIDSRFIRFQLRLFGKELRQLDGYNKKGDGQWSYDWIRCLESGFGKNKLLQPYKQYPWIYIAIREIAVAISQVPFLIYRGNDLLEEGPVYETFRKPNPYTSRYEFKEAVMTYLCLDGNAYIVMLSVNNKIPDELWVFGKEWMTRLKDQNSNRTVGYRLNSKVPQTFDARQVIHLKLFNPYAPTEGLSPVTVARLTAEVDYSAMKYNKKVLENGAEPGGILTPKDKDIVLNESQIKLLREQWEERHKGVDKVKRVSVMPAALEYKATSLSQKDMEFLRMRQYSREEILAIWQVPKGVVGITDDLNYATLWGQKKIFWQETLLPYLTRFEDAIDSGYFKIYADDLWGEFDRKSIPELHEDFREKMDSAHRMWQMGWPINAINERLDLGMPKVPWGDTVFIPMSMIPIDMAGEYQAQLSNGSNGKGGERLALPIIKVEKPEELRLKRWVNFLNRVDPVERKLTSKLQRYFFEQRKLVLELLLKHSKDVGDYEFFFSWEEQEEKLMNVSRPYYRDAIQNGSRIVADVLGVEAFDISNPLAIQAIEHRCTRITQCTRTMKRKIANQLREGMVRGESIMQLSDRVKQEYNIARSRSLTIARTEVVGVTNEGEQLEMESEGVEKRTWVTAGDEAVRESHEAVNGTVVKLNEPFILINPKTGARTEVNYPGDSQCGNGAEVINCRCTVYPVS